MDMADRRSFSDIRYSSSNDYNAGEGSRPNTSQLLEADSDEMSLGSVYGSPSTKFSNDSDKSNISDISVGSSPIGRPRVESKGAALPEHLLNSVRRKEESANISLFSQSGIVNH